jgi:hypothetical protein
MHIGCFVICYQGVCFGGGVFPFFKLVNQDLGSSKIKILAS